MECVTGLRSDAIRISVRTNWYVIDIRRSSVSSALAARHRTNARILPDKNYIEDSQNKIAICPIIHYCVVYIHEAYKLIF